MSCGVALIASKNGWLGQYVQIIDEWQAGNQTTGLLLAGKNMLYWGRVGKILQFIAGLVVILDLLDVDKLRQHGLDARRRRFGNISRLQGMNTAKKALRFKRGLRHAIYRPVSQSSAPATAPAPLRAASLRWMLTDDPKFRFAGDEPDVRTEVEDFRNGVLAELESRIEITEFGRVISLDDRNYVDRRVDEFVDERIQSGPRMVISRMRDVQTLLGRIQDRILGLLAVATVSVLVLGWLDILPAGIGLTIGVAYAILLVLGTTLLFVLSIINFPSAVLVPYRVFSIFFTMSAKLTAMTLDRARPLHFFRYIGLALFVIGFHLDLLAS